MKKKLILPLLVAGLAVSTPLASLAADAEPQAATEISEQEVVAEAAVETGTEEIATEEIATEESVPVTFNDTYGTWQRSGNRYWFRFDDGSYPYDEVGTIEGVTYAFDKDGWMVTGWGYVDGHWYYCNGSGAMQFGWQSIGGHWYYLDPEHGFMYADGFKEINGQTYRFNANGTLFYGWYQETGSWYYFDGNGYLSTGWKYINGTWYFFDTGSYEMLSDGWYTINSVDYYFLPSGAMADGWVQKEGKWYYYSGGKEYTGWLASGGHWYYIIDNYMIHNQPEFRPDTDSNDIYGFDENGIMITGWHYFAFEDEDGPYSFWYYYKSNGLTYNGWLAENGNWYYITDGWMIDDGVWYIGDDGELGGDNSKAYAFTTSGTMVRNNWFYETWYDGETLRGQWGYFDADGAGHEGWLLYGGKWYYCKEGAMYSDGVYKINDKYCSFDASGVWQGYVDVPPQ